MEISISKNLPVLITVFGVATALTFSTITNSTDAVNTEQESHKVTTSWQDINNGSAKVEESTTREVVLDQLELSTLKNKVIEISDLLVLDKDTKEKIETLSIRKTTTDKAIDVELQRLIKKGDNPNSVTGKEKAIELYNLRKENSLDFEYFLKSALSYEQQQKLQDLEQKLIIEKQKVLIDQMFDSIILSNLKNLSKDQIGFIDGIVERVLNNPNVGSYSLGYTIQRVDSGSAAFIYEIAPQFSAVLDEVETALTKEQKTSINFDVLKRSLQPPQ